MAMRKCSKLGVCALTLIALPSAWAARPLVQPSVSGQGTLTYSAVGSGKTLNPFQYAGPSTVLGSAALAPFGIGYSLGPGGRLQTGFYDGLPRSSHGSRTWVVTLRRDLRWSNGMPITNKDVLLAWHVEMNGGSGPYCLATCDVISAIELRGSRRLVFHLRRHVARDVLVLQDLPSFLPYDWRGLGSNQSACLRTKTACDAIAARLWTDGSFNYEGPSYVTSGPYRVATASSPSPNRVVFTPNTFWKPFFVDAKGGATPAKLEYVQYPDSGSLMAAASSGAVDATSGYTAAQLDVLRASASSCGRCFRILMEPTFAPEELLMNAYSGKVDVAGGPAGIDNPVAKLRVRQALALAYAPTSVESIAYGISQKAAAKLSSVSNPFVSLSGLRNSYADSAITGAWDPLRGRDIVSASSAAFTDARRLLKLAGYRHGPTVYVTTNGTDNPIRAREVSYLGSKRAWGRIGVSLKYVNVTTEQLFQDWDAGGLGPHGRYEMLILGYNGTAPLPEGWRFDMASQYCPRTAGARNAELGENWSCIRNHQIDAAFARLAISANVEKRRRLADVISEQLNRKVYWAILGTAPAISTADAHVGGVADGGLPIFSPWAWRFRP